MSLTIKPKLDKAVWCTARNCLYAFQVFVFGIGHKLRVSEERPMDLMSGPGCKEAYDDHYCQSIQGVDPYRGENCRHRGV